MRALEMMLRWKMVRIVLEVPIIFCVKALWKVRRNFTLQFKIPLILQHGLWVRRGMVLIKDRRIEEN